MKRMNDLVRRIIDLQELIQDRKNMLDALGRVYRCFPDADIQAIYEHIQDMTRDRIAVAYAQLENLEAMYEEVLEDAVK